MCALQHNSSLPTQEFQSVKYRTFDDFSVRRFNLELSNSLTSLLDGISSDVNRFK